MFGGDQILYILIYAVYLIVQFGAGIHILFTKHEEPSSALLWLLVITILPVVGLMLYLMLGINRLKTMESSMRNSSDRFNSSKTIFTSAAAINNYLSCLQRFSPDRKLEPAPEFSRVLDKLLPDCNPISCNSLELLEDGTMAYPRMLEDIINARYSIRMQSFIIMDDPVGRAVFDALAKKAEEGVDVKVLYDSFGSFYAGVGHFFRRYSQRKIPKLRIRAFSPINIFTPWRIQMRNHRKLLVIDGKVAFVGGINISEENVPLAKTPKRKHIHDLHCRIAGPSVADFQFQFFKDWIFATGKALEDVAVAEDFPPPEPAGDAIVRVVNSGPGQNPEATQNVFFTAAATAQKYLWIMTPYFVPDHSYLSAICMAAARGVDVRIIVPKNNNHFFVDMAAQSFYRKLLHKGVKIYERKGFFSHAKAMIIDSEWAYLGSSNCDVRSFRLNFELDFCVEKGSFLKDVEQQFRNELTQSDEVQLEAIENKKFIVRLMENLCALLAPIL